MRFQGYTATHDNDGVVHAESSAIVDIDRSNPAIYLDCSDLPSLTRQEFAEECDVNAIMAKYEKTGILPVGINNDLPRYLDVSDVPDLQQSLEMLNQATAAFMALPASVRREFDNDAVKFVAFAQDPTNIEDMRKWGLAPPPKAPEEPQKVQVISMPDLDKDAPKKP